MIDNPFFPYASADDQLVQRLYDAIFEVTDLYPTISRERRREHVEAAFFKWPVEMVRRCYPEAEIQYYRVLAILRGQYPKGVQ